MDAELIAKRLHDELLPMIDPSPMGELVRAAIAALSAQAEPVVWQYRYTTKAGRPSGWCECADEAGMRESSEYLRAAGRVVKTRILYTAPPASPALVEALRKLSAEWRKNARWVAWGDEFEAGSNQRYGLCADTLDAALAKHKENSR